MNDWILSTHNEAANYRLFCFPHAGSGSIKYTKWANYIDKKIEVCPVMLPGREYRLNEPLINDYKVMVDAIFDGIKDNLTEKRYSFFGHSMGSLLSYELTKKLEREGLPKPDMLFLSGVSLTTLVYTRDWSTVKDDEIAEYLVKMSGAPQKLVDKPSFREIFFPTFISDHQLVTGYHYKPEKLKDNTPIRAFAAKDDTIVNVKYVENLKTLTDDFKISYFTGGHFYVDHQGDKVCDFINEELMKYVD